VGRNYGRDLARALGFPGGKIPAVGTLHAVLSGLNRQALEQALTRWAECVLAHLPSSITPAPATVSAIALDGKTLRGSKGQGACDMHLPSVIGWG
jgi:hypothetical protein